VIPGGEYEKRNQKNTNDYQEKAIAIDGLEEL